MERFDVVIAGAGPAGAHAARLLSRAGLRVLVAEKYRNFSDNDFSSAGAPIEILKQFDLPDHLAASRWRGLELFSSSERHAWWAPHDVGVVLDFAALRAFLIGEAVSAGAVFKNFTEYDSHAEHADHVIVRFNDKSLHTSFEVSASHLLDGTGQARAVLQKCAGYRGSKKYLKGVGLEHLVEVPAKDWFGDRLQMFLGARWAPQGYAWIFPMSERRLKVGVCRYMGAKEAGTKSLKALAEDLLHESFPRGNYSIVDTHGGLVRYASGRRESVVCGRVVGLGDAVSTINPLGGEGIRHAMLSAEWACEALVRALRENNKSALKAYPRRLSSALDKNWRRSEWLAKFVYLHLSDSSLDRILRRLKRFDSVEPLMRILFFYDFSTVRRGVARAFRQYVAIRFRRAPVIDFLLRIGQARAGLARPKIKRSRRCREKARNDESPL